MDGEQTGHMGIPGIAQCPIKPVDLRSRRVLRFEFDEGLLESHSYE